MPVIPGTPLERWAVQPSRPDPRDYIYTLKVCNPLLTRDRPRRYINQRLVVRDQGEFGTCGGQAAANAKDIRERTITSPLFIYRMTKEIDGIEGEGVTIRDLMKVLQKHGVCREELYPYNQYKKALVFPPLSQAAIQDAATRKIEEYVRVQTIEEVCDAIFRYGSVVAGVLVTDSFLTPERDHILMPDGYIRGGHAVDLIGYDMDMQYTYSDGRKCIGFFLLANSWGPAWGKQGNAWLPFDFVRDRSDLMSYVLDMWVPIDHFQKTVEEKTMDVAPFIQEERTFVPARFIAEALGADVFWYPEDKRVEIVKDDIRVEMWIGENKYRITRRDKL